jgi:hypothetical protein
MFDDSGAEYSPLDIMNGKPAVAERTANAISHERPDLLSKKLSFAHIYDPEKGLQPDDNGVSPRWKSTYRSGCSQITADGNVNGKVLELDNTGSGRNDYPRYVLNKDGTGTDWRFLVIDFNLKMTPVGEKACFHIGAAKKTSNGMSSRIYLRIHPSWIQSGSGQSADIAHIDLGGKWHNYRIIADFKKRRLDVHVDGSRIPALTAPLKLGVGKVPAMTFGDGSSSINGKVKLGKLKWRHSN